MLPIDSRARILLFQGNVSERTRNLENVIQAIGKTKHQDVALVIVGPEAHVDARKNLAKLGENCGVLGKRLFFLDAVAQAQLLDVTASADAAIVPYVHTDLNTALCTPNKLFEFLVAGIPILGNSLKELCRFIEGNNVGINRPLNTIEEITRALDEFFDLDLVKMRVHCATIAPKFVWDIQGEKVVDLVSKVTRTVDRPRTVASNGKPRRELTVVTVVGARPQFVKAAAVSRAFQSVAGVRERLIHTGQHYDANMSDVFFEELRIPAPSTHLGIGSGKHGEQTGLMIMKLEAVLESDKPDVVLLYGDTNSTLAGSIAASKLSIPIAHVEAGLRAFTRFKPEEINRILTDHNSDILYPPTEKALKQLQSEGLGARHIKCVGDVMLDVALESVSLAQSKHGFLNSLGVQRKSFALCSLHRQENTDDKARLEILMEVLSRTARTMPIVLPLHPRTKARLQQFGLSIAHSNIRVTEPVGYLEMVLLEREAALILTDSGGVQKEAYFHGTPCVTLRDETEWTELLETGWNSLAPLSDVESMLEIIERMRSTNFARLPRPPLYGDGKAASKIVEDLKQYFGVFEEAPQGVPWHSQEGAACVE